MIDPEMWLKKIDQGKTLTFVQILRSSRFSGPYRLRYMKIRLTRPFNNDVYNVTWLTSKKEAYLTTSHNRDYIKILIKNTAVLSLVELELA